MKTRNWEPMPSLRQQRKKASSCIVGETAYVFGGHGGSGYLASIEKLSLEGPHCGVYANWQIIHPPVEELSGRQELIVVPSYNKKKIIIFGG